VHFSSGGGRDLATAATFSKPVSVKSETQTSGSSSSGGGVGGASSLKLQIMKPQQQMVYPKVSTKSSTSPGYDHNKLNLLAGHSYGIYTLLYLYTYCVVCDFVELFLFVFRVYSQQSIQ
jgi:hypothetical protein